MLNVQVASGLKLVLLLFLFIMSGCSTPAVVLNIYSDPLLNQDVHGQSYSVLVVLYQLKSPDQFEKADYKLLLEQNPDALGANLISREEFIVEPDQSYRLEFHRENKSEHFGLVAFFRQVEGEQWKVAKKLDNGLLRPMTTKSDVYLKGNRIYIIGKH